MLIKPSIIKLPKSAYPVLPDSLRACSQSYYAPDGSSCARGFACKPYKGAMNSCQDADYCGSGLGGTVALGVGGVAVGIGGIGITIIT